MNKTSLILKYFQKSDQLVVENKEYQQTISSLFQWLTNNDKVNSDKTTKYFPNLSSKAIIVAKQTGVIAGLEEIEYLLEKYTKLVFKPITKDGSVINNKETIAEIKGKSHEILGYERTMLNILQRMSGIATETNRLINLISPSHHTTSITNSSDSMYLLSIDKSIPLIAATRKTPWMSLDKKAVSVGGGLTHRLNLSDGILIKDNHLKLISKAVKTPQQRTIQDRFYGSSILDRERSGQLIEIEVESEKQAYQAIKTFQHFDHSNHIAILFDNFTPSRVKTILSDLGNLYNLSDIIFEASGGIDEKNILDWAQTGVDIISLGSLTHSTYAANLSLELVTK